MAALIAITAIVFTKYHAPISSEYIYKWSLIRSFNIERRALAAVTSTTHLYVIGGVDQHNRYVDTVEYAAILSNGQLGEWRKTSPLKIPRFYLDAVYHNGYIYALGGGLGEIGGNNQPSAAIERAKVLANGALGPWESLPPLLTPRRGLKAIVWNQKLYATGGYNGVFLKSVEFAPIKPNGELGQWRISEEAKIDRYIHSAATSNNRLYLLGGHVNKKEVMSYGDVESAKLLPDRPGLEQWRTEKSRLLSPRFISCALADEQYLYIFGGHTGGQRLNSVEMAPIDDHGHVGHWQYTTPMMMARSAAAVVRHGNYIYALGGMDQQRVLNTVEYTQRLENGQLGFRHTDNIELPHNPS